MVPRRMTMTTRPVLIFCIAGLMSAALGTSAIAQTAAAMSGGNTGSNAMGGGGMSSMSPTGGPGIVGAGMNRAGMSGGGMNRNGMSSAGMNRPGMGGTGMGGSGMSGTGMNNSATAAGTGMTQPSTGMPATGGTSAMQPSAAPGGTPR